MIRFDKNLLSIDKTIPGLIQLLMEDFV